MANVLTRSLLFPQNPCRSTRCGTAEHSSSVSPSAMARAVALTRSVSRAVLRRPVDQQSRNSQSTRFGAQNKDRSRQPAIGTVCSTSAAKLDTSTGASRFEMRLQPSWDPTAGTSSKAFVHLCTSQIFECSGELARTGRRNRLDFRCGNSLPHATTAAITMGNSHLDRPRDR